VSATTARRTDLRYRIGLNLRAVVGRSYPRIIGANREPSWIFFEAILPLLGISAYVFIYHFFASSAIAATLQTSASAPWGMCGKTPCADAAAQAAYIDGLKAALNAYVATVVLGGTMVAFWLNVLWSMASQLYWEKEIGNLQLYMMAPMNRMALLGGMAVGGMFMTSVRALATLFAGIVVFGVIFVVADPFTLVAVFLVTLVALYGMGMMFASLYLLWGREAWNLSALMEEPIFFSSGMYFPIGGLYRIGGWGPALAIGGSVVPAALGLDALRQLTLCPFGPSVCASILPLAPVGTELTVLLVLALLFLILARYSLAYLETLAKREGKLTSRHQ
jgi:ABC-2 type transport system permease protein